MPLNDLPDDLQPVQASLPDDLQPMKQGELPGGKPAPGTAVLPMDLAPKWENDANADIATLEQAGHKLSYQDKANILEDRRARFSGTDRNSLMPSDQQVGASVAADNGAFSNFGAPIVQGEVQAGELFKHPFDANARNQDIQKVGAATQTTPGSTAAVAGQAANMGMQMAPMLAGPAGMAYGMAQGVGNVANAAEISGAGAGATAADMGLQAGTMALMGPMAGKFAGALEPILGKAAGVAGTALAGGAMQAANNTGDIATGVDANKTIGQGVLPAMIGGGLAHGITQLAGAHAAPAAEAPQTFEGHAPTFEPAPDQVEPGVMQRMAESAKAQAAAPAEVAKPAEDDSFLNRGTIEAAPKQTNPGTDKQIAEGMAKPDETPQRRTSDQPADPDADRELIRQAMLAKEKAGPNFGKRSTDAFDPNAPTLLQRLRANHEAWKSEQPTESPDLSDSEQQPGMLQRMGAHASRLLSDESGGDNAAQKFVAEDVKPQIEDLGNGLKDAITGVHQMFGQPIKEIAGADAETTKGLMRERGAELAQRSDQLSQKFNDAQTTLDKLPVDQQRQITDDAERGQPQRDPKMQPLADAIRGEYDDRLAQMKARDPNFTGIEDYMGHAYEQPDKASSVLSEIMSKRPLAGSKGFTKERTIPFQSDAIAGGLKPVTDNPVEMMRMKVAGMDKWITAHDIGTDLTSRGIIKDLPPGGKAIDGHTALTDPQFRGKMAPDEVANVFNNALSPGLGSLKQFGGLYRGARAVGNVLNQVQLGVSGMHVMTSTINSAVSDFGLGMKQVLSGDVAGGLKSMATGTTGTSAFRDLWNGTQMLKEWNKPGSTTPELGKLVDYMKAGGGRANMDSFYHTGMTEKMMQAFRGGNVIGGAVRAPMAGIEQLAKPIMEKLVPRLKMGAFMQMAKGELAKNPNMTDDQMRASAGNAWDSIDNRFGEMVHDNLFWNKSMHDLALLATRSVGWNLGTAREGLGAAKDFLQTASRIKAGGDVLTHRAAYAIALPTLVGLWGGLMHRAMTGQNPASVKDYFHPATGEKDRNGDDVRIQLPTYMKDFFSIKDSPGGILGTAASKMSPMLGTAIDLMKNKDFMNQQIMDQNDSPVGKLLDGLKYIGKSLEPISITNAAKAGGGVMDRAAASLGGVAKAPAYEIRSAAENAAHDLMPEEAARDRDQVAKGAAKASKSKPGLAGLLSRSQLDASDIMSKVWPKMTDDEKQKNTGLIRQRIAAANVPFMQRQQMYTQLRGGK